MRDAIPFLAIDSHMQVYGPGCMPDGVASASAAECRAVMARSGIARAVIVQPEACGADNRCLLEALAALGPDARGVAILSGTASERDLDLLGAQGVSGIRLFLNPDMVDGGDGRMRVASRAAERGWHIDLVCDAAGLAEQEVWLRRLPGRLVLDAGPADRGEFAIDDAALAVFRRLLDSGRAWLKLSGPELSPAVLHRLIEHAPDRLVWGSRWPHGTADPAAISALLPDAAMRAKMLRNNPAALYGFDAE